MSKGAGPTGSAGFLTDKDPMPFGKYKDKPMGSIPADYFFYLWTNGMEFKHSPVAEYIRSNLASLELEFPDGIWRK